MAKETDDSFGDIMPSSAAEIPSVVVESITASGNPVAPSQDHIVGVPPSN